MASTGAPFLHIIVLRLLFVGRAGSHPLALIVPSVDAEVKCIVTHKRVGTFPPQECTTRLPASAPTFPRVSAHMLAGWLFLVQVESRMRQSWTSRMGTLNEYVGPSTGSTRAHARPPACS